MVDQQNTHWYRSQFSLGWTANPEHALPGEIERVGFHDCAGQGCQEIHSCSAIWYEVRRVREFEAAQQTARGHRAEGVRADETRPVHRDPVLRQSRTRTVRRKSVVGA